MVEEIIDMRNIKDKNSSVYNKNISSNVKRILCTNIVTKKYCSYGKKCIYAHALDDQIIDTDRVEAYDILRSDVKLDKINLITNTSLYHIFDILTKLCQYCSNNCCPGGYNCHRGACDKQYQICSDDLKNGNCNKLNCPLIHLTKRGLIPYHDQQSQKYKSIKPILNIPRTTISPTKPTSAKLLTIWDNAPVSLYKKSTEQINISTNSISDNIKPKDDLLTQNNGSIFIKHTTKKDASVKKKKKSINKNELEGILLTDKFFKTKLITDDDSNANTSDDFETCNDIKKTISYLNSETDYDSENESIFIE